MFNQNHLIMAQRNLNVKTTNKAELTKQWGIIPLGYSPSETLYIRCNAKGQVNWDKAPVYQAHELVERKVTILNQ